MLIFLDSNSVIYRIEKHPTFGPKVAARLAAALANGDRLIVSDLTRLECRVIPLRKGDARTLAQFDRFFHSALVDVRALTASVCDRAAEIRARHRYQLADSLNLAAAVEAGCGIFLTNDGRLGKFPGLVVEELP